MHPKRQPASRKGVQCGDGLTYVCSLTWVRDVTLHLLQERNGPLRGKGVWKMPTGLVSTLHYEHTALECCASTLHQHAAPAGCAVASMYGRCMPAPAAVVGAAAWRRHTPHGLNCMRLAPAPERVVQVQAGEDISEAAEREVSRAGDGPLPCCRAAAAMKGRGGHVCLSVMRLEAWLAPNPRDSPCSQHFHPPPHRCWRRRVCACASTACWPCARPTALPL